MCFQITVCLQLLSNYLEAHQSECQRSRQTDTLRTLPSAAFKVPSEITTYFRILLPTYLSDNRNHRIKRQKHFTKCTSKTENQHFQCVVVLIRVSKKLKRKKNFYKPIKFISNLYQLLKYHGLYIIYMFSLFCPALQ